MQDRNPDQRPTLGTNPVDRAKEELEAKGGLQALVRDESQRVPELTRADPEQQQAQQQAQAQQQGQQQGQRQAVQRAPADSEPEEHVLGRRGQRLRLRPAEERKGFEALSWDPRIFLWRGFLSDGG